MNLEAVYPNSDEPSEEMSFEELRAKARGWTDRDWVTENEEIAFELTQSEEYNQGASSIMQNKQVECLLQVVEQGSDLQKVSELRTDSVLDEEARLQKSGRPKKLKIREVKAEVQTGIVPLFHLYK